MKLRRRKATVRVEMLPLMDVVFLLLVFFIFSMMTMTVHRGLTVNLPRSATAEIERTVSLVLTVAADGSLFLDKESVAPDGLAAALAARMHTAPDAAGMAVRVFADAGVRYQDLYRVLDRLKAGGVTRISLQARAETGR